MNEEKKYLKRKKQIHKRRNVRIWPSLILLTLFSVFFVIAFIMATDGVMEVILYSQLETARANFQEFTQSVEEANKENEDHLQVSLPKAYEGRVYITDASGNVVIGSIPAGYEEAKKYTFYFVNDRTEEEETAGEFWGESTEKLFASSGISAFHSYTYIVEFLETMDERDILKGNDKIYATFMSMVNVPLFDGKYVAYYNADIVLRYSNLYVLVVMYIMLVLVAIIPTTFFFINVVVNYRKQKKNTALLFADHVTGEKNWLYFEDRLDRIISRGKNPLRQYQVMADISFEKYSSFCSCYSAATGEEMLRRFSNVIKKNLAKKEFFARYVDAEFVMYIGAQSAQACEARMQQLIKELRACCEEHKVELSCGLCEITKELRDVDVLYRDASAARMNIAEDAAYRIAWYDENLKKERLWEAKVEESMDAALANGEFRVYIQPKYTAATRVLGGAEALIRWISPTEGFIGPGRFIPIFEKNGFITKIDDFMLESVAKLQKHWIEEGKKVVPISVNVSRVHFTQEDLAEHICEIVERAGAPKECIELELTESAFFEDKNALIRTVKKLRDMGFAVSMDDFGAGYSSLNSLKDLPLDVVKLDAEFFRGEAIADNKGSLIISETIRLVKGLGMRIVAEGIEEEPQVNYLADRECDLIQGFYFAKPMPAEEYAERMETL